MSKIVEVLRDTEEGEDVHISSEDMKTLVEILSCVAVAIQYDRLWFNDKSTKTNLQYVEFCTRMAKKFANIKIEEEQ